MKYQELTGFIEQFYLNPIRETYQYADVDEGYMADKRMIFSPVVSEFSEAVMAFVADNPDMDLYDYDSIISGASKGRRITAAEAAEKEYLKELDGRTVCAWIVSTVRAEMFREGILYDCIRKGYVMAWLRRLAELDEEEL